MNDNFEQKATAILIQAGVPVVGTGVSRNPKSLSENQYVVPIFFEGISQATRDVYKGLIKESLQGCSIIDEHPQIYWDGDNPKIEYWFFIEIEIKTGDSDSE